MEKKSEASNLFHPFTERVDYKRVETRERERERERERGREEVKQNEALHRTVRD